MGDCILKFLPEKIVCSKHWHQQQYLELLSEFLCGNVAAKLVFATMVESMVTLD